MAAVVTVCGHSDRQLEADWHIDEEDLFTCTATTRCTMCVQAICGGALEGAGHRRQIRRLRARVTRW